jgi:hypothetical protein
MIALIFCLLVVVKKRSERSATAEHTASLAIAPFVPESAYNESTSCHAPARAGGNPYILPAEFFAGA